MPSTIVRRVLVLLAAVCASACTSTSETTCMQDGTTYAAGASFPSSDGCNACSCESDGRIVCTLRACAQDGGHLDAAADAAPIDAAPADAADSATDRADTATDADALCSVADTYRFGRSGGLAFWIDETTLSPLQQYRHVRTYFRGTDGGPSEVECSPALPPCGTNDDISLRDIARDLGHPDVMSAFAEATPPLFGIDTTPVDGQVYSVTRSDGRRFSVGEPCDQRQPSCRAIPAGVQALVDHLSDLDTQMLAKPECAALQQP